MKVLIGDTGLVGGVLQEQTRFDATFNSSNIEDLPRQCPEIKQLYLACLPATKWLINKSPNHDLANAINIVSILQSVKIWEVVLYSTIDVYQDSPAGVDERFLPSFSGVNYGSNRLVFEQLIQHGLPNAKVKIIRLPALFHRSIKKNILYDLLNDNCLEQANVNSAYQWYPLNKLWRDTENAPFAITNLFPPPIETQVIVERFFPEKKLWEGPKVVYNFCTKYSITGYLYDQQTVLQLMEAFINEVRS